MEPPIFALYLWQSLPVIFPLDRWKGFCLKMQIFNAVNGHPAVKDHILSHKCSDLSVTLGFCPVAHQCSSCCLVWVLLLVWVNEVMVIDLNFI